VNASVKRRSPEKLVIRRARPDDLEPLLAMCRSIWGGTDYLPLVLDRWLSDKRGTTLVATLRGTPVGMSRIALLGPREVWQSSTSPTSTATCRSATWMATTGRLQIFHAMCAA